MKTVTIIFEGDRGSGKSTLLRFLQAKLQDERIATVFVRNEPNKLVVNLQHGDFKKLVEAGAGQE